jgi:hypothetical protein
MGVLEIGLECQKWISFACRDDDIMIYTSWQLIGMNWVNYLGSIKNLLLLQ